MTLRTTHLPVTLALLALVLFGGAAAAALAAPGDLDPSFDGDGKKTIDYTGNNDAAEAVLVQPDGKIVLAGTGNPNRDFAITRLNSDGSFDNSFDGDGTIGINFGGLDDAADAALQPDGKIVVAGGTDVGLNAAILRLNPNGSLDLSFDAGGTAGDGKKTIDYTGGDFSNAVLVQPDGRIVVAGYGNPNSDFAMTRLNSDGSFDNSFDGDGTIGIDFGGNDSGTDAALQPDGKIVVAGATSVGNNVAILRLNSNGSLDGTFDTGGADGSGKKTIDYGGNDAALAVLVQPDGKIVVAGYGNPNSDFAITRLNSDGSFDNTFDGDGTVGINLGGTDLGRAAALQPNGKIVVAGSTSVGGTDFALARVQPGGALDSTFDGVGTTTVEFGGSDLGTATALQPDGKISVAGWTSVGAGNDVAIARIEGDPPASGGGGPGGGSTRIPRCARKQATIVGTAARDVLRGTRRADVIAALGGNDVVKGARGNDRICGGKGKDKLSGGKGRDRLYGDAGNDRLLGEAGNDRLLGGAGKDRLRGGPGRDRLNGGSGKDRCTGRDKKSSC